MKNVRRDSIVLAILKMARQRSRRTVLPVLLDTQAQHQDQRAALQFLVDRTHIKMDLQVNASLVLHALVLTTIAKHVPKARMRTLVAPLPASSARQEK